MSQPWHKTSSTKETKSFSEDFWKKHSAEIRSEEFWADRIRSLKDNPVERLRLAIENLPLPGAFREAAVATRAIIREKRKADGNHEQELQILYWLAAIDSFSIPYSNRLKMPGYNIMELVPGEELKSLSFTYTQLGYEQLPLLNKTDFKWLVQAWGEPKKHTTLHKLHRALWIKYEDIFAGEMQKGDEELVAIIKSNQDASAALRGDIAQPALPKPAVIKSMHINRSFIVAGIATAIVLYTCSR